jgi:hypothetical protein
LSTLKTLKIPTARVFEPLLQPARCKGVYGGRGSGKSHFFGEPLVETCQAERGTLAICIREAQRPLAQSSKRLIEGKIASLGLGQGFKLFNDKIVACRRKLRRCSMRFIERRFSIARRCRRLTRAIGGSPRQLARGVCWFGAVDTCAKCRVPVPRRGDEERLGPVAAVAFAASGSKACASERLA